MNPKRLPVSMYY